MDNLYIYTGIADAFFKRLQLKHDLSFLFAHLQKEDYVSMFGTIIHVILNDDVNNAIIQRIVQTHSHLHISKELYESWFDCLKEAMVEVGLGDSVKHAKHNLDVIFAQFHCNKDREGNASHPLYSMTSSIVGDSLLVSNTSINVRRMASCPVLGEQSESYRGPQRIVDSGGGALGEDVDIAIQIIDKRIVELQAYKKELEGRRSFDMHRSLS